MGCVIAVSAAEDRIPSYNAASRMTDRYGFTEIEDRLLQTKSVYPAWDFSGKIFKHLSEIQVGCSYDSAVDGYSPAGELSNSSTYWLKRNRIPLRDFCALSRLMEQNEIVYDFSGPVNISPLAPAAVTKDVAAQSTVRHFLRYLAPREIEFTAKTSRQNLSLAYARSCWDDYFYLGFELNLTHVKQDFDMVSVFTPSEATLVASDKQTNKYNFATSEFPLEYPNGLRSIFDRLMLFKNFGLDQNDQVFLIGDSKVFLNFPLRWHSRPLGACSIYAIINSPHQFNSKKPLQAFTGKPYRGPTLGASIGFVLPYSDLLNFNFYTYANYSFESMVMRRVPRIIDRKVSAGVAPAVSGTDIELNLPLSSAAIRYRQYSAINQPDSYVPELSDKFVSINMRYGPEFGMQVGNVFNNLFVNNLSCDLSYRFNFKANDTTGTPNADQDYDRELAVADSFSMSHVARAQVGYQYNESVSFFAGGNYVFAGRRCLKDREISVGVSGIF
jgi:hypothetical protein